MNNINIDLNELIVGSVYQFECFKWYKEPFKDSNERELKNIYSENKDINTKILKGIFLGVLDVDFVFHVSITGNKYIWTKWLIENKIIYVIECFIMHKPIKKL